MGSLYKQRGSSMWWMKTYVNGRSTRESTGTADRKEAERILKQREGRVAEGHIILPRLDLMLYDEVAQDLCLHYQTTGTHYLKEAEYRLVHLDPLFIGKRVAKIPPAEVTAYIAHRQKEGAAPKSINNELEVLIKMLRLAYENGKLMRLPVIHKLKVNNVRKGFFAEEAYKNVRRLLPSDYQAVLAIEYTYGWRPQSEVLMLEWRMVDFSAGALRLDPGMTKNDDGRVVHLTPEVKQLLIEQRERVKE